MLIAKELKKENISEYLLYMWQVEDIIRANDLDIDKIQEQIIDRFEVSEDIKKEIRYWYEGLIEMMQHENIKENGHLVINNNIIRELTDLHIHLLNSPKESQYSAMYYKALPFIVELRSKTGNKDVPEIENCFAALYGFLLMRLQQKEISGETQAAITQISSLLRQLSIKYSEDREGTLNLD